MDAFAWTVIGSVAAVVGTVAAIVFGLIPLLRERQGRTEVSSVVGEARGKIPSESTFQAREAAADSGRGGAPPTATDISPIEEVAEGNKAAERESGLKDGQGEQKTGGTRARGIGPDAPVVIENGAVNTAQVPLARRRGRGRLSRQRILLAAVAVAATAAGATIYAVLPSRPVVPPAHPAGSSTPSTTSSASPSGRLTHPTATPVATGASQLGVLTNADGYYIRNVAFSPDGTLIAGFGASPTSNLFEDKGNIYLWTVANQQPAGAPLTDNSEFSSPAGLAFSPDGKTLVAGDAWGSDLYLWYLPTRSSTVVGDPGKNNISAIAVSRDGKTIAEGDVSGNIHLLNVSPRKWTSTFADPTAVSGYQNNSEDPIEQVLLSPSETTMAARNYNGEAYVWDLAGGPPIGALSGVTNTVNAIAFSPDGAILALAKHGTELWDVTSRKVTATLSGPDTSPQVEAFIPGGTTLAVGDTNGTIYLWNTITKQITGSIHSGIGRWGGLAVSPNGQILAAFSRGTSKIYLYRIKYSG
jgi:sugar lactone lactonase YvrE